MPFGVGGIVDKERMDTMYKGKVIDFHVHVGNFSQLREDIQNLLMIKNDNRDFNVKEVFSNPEILAKYLQKANIEMAVLLGEDGPATNFHITSKFVCNFKAQAPQQYRDMFVCLGCLNPNNVSETVLEKYRKDVKKGIVGYKLYPSDHNFNPFSDELMEMYEEMEKNKHILMFHTGESAQVDSVSMWQNPAEYRILAEKFPELSIVLCHGGKKKYSNDSFAMMKEYQRLYVDTGFISIDTLNDMYPKLEEVADKILFASDMPGGVHSLKKYIDSFRQMNASDEVVGNILYFNAKKIINRVKENEYV